MKQKKKYTPAQAFTLIELLVVIVIIGILATISTATFNDSVEKAKLAKITSQISQQQKIFKLDCLGEGKDLADCPVTYSNHNIPNASGGFRYGASPEYCEDFCMARSTDTISVRVPTVEESIWLAETGVSRCNAGWQYQNNSAETFSRGYPMYRNQTVPNCGPINTGDVARYISWGSNYKRGTTTTSDCHCISYPVFD